MQPRLLARIAGAFYVSITGCALFAYLYVRRHVIVVDDMTQTAANFVAHEQLYRLGFAGAVFVVVMGLPLGFILSELLKVVNARLAQLALVFITASTTIEAVNLIHYIEPLLTFTLPGIGNAFGPEQVQALARGPIQTFAYLLSVSLTFFGAFCVLVGVLIFRSTFLPKVLGVLMIAAGVIRWINAFRLFLELPIPYIEWLTLIAENSLALWLLVVGVNETKWRERAAGMDAGTIRPT